MSWPKPTPGLVIRYAYLWADEAARRQDEGLKDRPAAIVVTSVDQDGQTIVWVAPITHHPRKDTKVVRLPVATAKRLGLDGEPQWIVIDELNRFVWPGPDLRPQQGQGLESVVIGAMPDGLYKIVYDAVRTQIAAKQMRDTKRSE